MNDPIETERYLALNAYLCVCSAVGCFMGSMYAVQMFRVFLDEMFYMGIAFCVAALILLALADFRVPTAIFRYVIMRERRAGTP